VFPADLRDLVLLEAPLLAVIQIFVYVCAIMVLFLFVIMIDVREAVLQRFLPGGNLPALVLLVLLGIEMSALVLWSDRFAITEPVAVPRSAARAGAAGSQSATPP
jgi:NADH-quinone oxidoreductase subunit J